MTPTVGKATWVAGWLVVGFMAHWGLVDILRGDWVGVAIAFVPMPFIARYWWRQV